MAIRRPVLAVVLLAAMAVAQTTPPTPTPTPPAAAAPRTEFWFGLWPDFVAQFDPATDQVVRKIQVRHGLPFGFELTHDRQRFLVTTAQQRIVEVVDRRQGAVVDEHDFGEQGYIVRVRDITELPGGTQWYVDTERIKQDLDHYTFEPNQILLYDVATKKVLKKLRRLPEALRRGARISPDGRYWHVQTEDGDLAVLEPKTLQEVAKIDLHTPRFAGAGPLSVSTGQDLFRGNNKDAYRLLFQSQDPVQKNRTSWGLVDIDLQKQQVTRVLEWGQNPGAWGLQIAARKPVAATMMGGFGGSPFGGGSSSDRRMRLQLYDLETGRKVKESLEEFRPRRWLVAIAPDGDKLYVGVAGSDLEVFDADLKRIKTVELGGELFGQVFVLDG